MKEFGSGGFTAAVAATNGLIGQLAHAERSSIRWYRLRVAYRSVHPRYVRLIRERGFDDQRRLLFERVIHQLLEEG